MIFWLLVKKKKILLKGERNFFDLIIGILTVQTIKLIHKQWNGWVVIKRWKKMINGGFLESIGALI